MFKQTYSRFPNTICELRKDNEGNDQFIVGFSTDELTPDNVDMLLALDDGNQFSHCFKYLDYDQQV